MRLEAEAFDALADFADLLFGGVGLHYDEHGWLRGAMGKPKVYFMAPRAGKRDGEEWPFAHFALGKRVARHGGHAGAFHRGIPPPPARCHGKEGASNGIHRA